MSKITAGWVGIIKKYWKCAVVFYVSNEPFSDIVIWLASFGPMFVK